MPVNKLRKFQVIETDSSNQGGQSLPAGLSSRPMQNIYPLVSLSSGGSGSDFNSVTSNTTVNIDGTSYPSGTTLTDIVSALLGTDVDSISYANSTGVLTLTSSDGSVITATLSMEDDRTTTTTAITIGGTVYPIGTNLNTIITALAASVLANGEFKGVFADATAVNAVTSPQVGDTAYVTNTNTLLGGVSGTGGSVYWTGTVWSVYQLNGGTSDGGEKGSYANLTALTTAVTSPVNGDSAYLVDTVGATGGVSTIGGFVRYNSGSWSVFKLDSLATLTVDGLMDNTDFQKLAIQTLTDGATVSFDANLGNYGTLTVAGDRTIAAPTNTTVGEQYTVLITASGANRTVTFNTSWKKPDGTDLGAVIIPSGETRAFTFIANTATFHQIGFLSSSSISVYSAGNGAIVTATGTGITFARTTLTEWAFTVPDGVELISGQIYSTTAQSPGANVYIAFNNNGTRVYNNNTFGTDAKPPKIWGINMAGTSDATIAVSRANPQNYAITTGATNLLPRLTAVGSGDVEVELQNYTTALGASAAIVFFNF